MPTTKVNSPHGIVSVNHPEGASEEEIIAYAKKNYGAQKNKGADIYDMLSGEVSATQMLDSVINPVREFAGGASYQLADEAEAAARWMVDRYAPRTEADEIAAQFGGEQKFISYEDFKQDIDEERAGWREQNPEMALGLEIAGGLMGPGGMLGKFGAGATPVQTMLRSGGIGAAEGAVYGFGEGTTIGDRLERAAMYGGMGFVGGGLIGGGIHKIAKKVKEAGAAGESIPGNRGQTVARGPDGRRR